VPAVELAVIRHTGSCGDVGLSYGALGKYVTEHTLGVDGPQREEFHTVGGHETGDRPLWETDIGWPIFLTRPDLSSVGREAERIDHPRPFGTRK
jgi:hypothetical protein